MCPTGFADEQKLMTLCFVRVTQEQQAQIRASAGILNSRWDDRFGEERQAGAFGVVSRHSLWHTHSVRSSWRHCADCTIVFFGTFIFERYVLISWTLSPSMFAGFSFAGFGVQLRWLLFLLSLASSFSMCDSVLHSRFFVLVG